jgi:hypothetical protein
MQTAIGELAKAGKMLQKDKQGGGCGVKKVKITREQRDAEVGDHLEKAAMGLRDFYFGQTGKDWTKPYFS